MYTVGMECKAMEGQAAGCRMWYVCFFFQAEDGIRDYKVTGVQTCALPIYVFRHARLDLKIVQSPTERAGRHQAIGGFRIAVVVAERESVAELMCAGPRCALSQDRKSVV